MSHKSLLFLAAIMVAVNFFSVIAFWHGVKHHRPDFADMYDAGREYLAGRIPSHTPQNLPSLRNKIVNSRASNGESFGIPEQSTHRIDTLHPPFEMVLFIALAMLPYPLACLVWLCCNLTLFWAVPLILWKDIVALHGNFQYVIFLLGSSLILFFALIQGQDAILLLFLFTASFVLLRSERDFLAGVTLGLAMFKFFLVLPLVAPLAIAGKKRFVGGFFACCACLLAISFSLVGPVRALSYYLFLFRLGTDQTTSIAEHAQFMPNLRGLLMAVLGPFLSGGMIILLAAILSLATMVLATVWVCRHRELSLSLRYAFLLANSAFASFHFFEHNAVILVLPLLLAGNEIAEQGPPKTAKAIFGIAAGGIYACPNLLLGRVELSMPLVAISTALLILAILMTKTTGKWITATESASFGNAE